VGFHKPAAGGWVAFKTGKWKGERREKRKREKNAGGVVAAYTPTVNMLGRFGRAAEG